ncbi:prostacyclin receptor [Denticeps clupeoides]|uniref:G-protein coupled receptors family 1 profile domain-containing protein n=1 Tax=Denticeps clupeoides TaxID=299321 RepID=A0AAY4CWW0_9TELE|nr:prostacyclin receptor [Denticeps clupeoides]
MLDSDKCEATTSVREDGNPVVSAIMFLGGLVGNLLALAILGVHRKERRTKTSVFYILVTGLAVTDLLGTCVLSPPVFVSYAYNSSLVGLTGGMHLCGLFAFCMTFFGLASVLILFAMAVERCLAISHPYFYSKRVRRGFAKPALLLIYLLTFAFCLLPFFGFGEHKQYCPGTWCFIKMEAGERAAAGQPHTLAYSLSYASIMALLIASIFLCNGSVIVSLCRMHRSQVTRRGSAQSSGRKKKMGSWFGQGEEEVDHLVLLASMTVIFIIFSLPLTICGFVSAITTSGTDDLNLMAFRFSALNPIVDPWVFILFRKAVFRHLRRLLCCRLPRRAVKTTAQTALSLPLEATEVRHPSTLQNKIYSSLQL